MGSTHKKVFVFLDKTFLYYYYYGEVVNGAFAVISGIYVMRLYNKSSDNNINNENESWKAKYLSLLDSQELAEKAYKLNQELLYKALARLSIAASGEPPSQLETYLQSIRELIKKGGDNLQLKTNLEQFSKEVNRIVVLASDKQVTDGDLELLFAYLLQNYTLDNQQSALAQLQKSFRSSDGRQQLFSAIRQVIGNEPVSELSCKGNGAIKTVIDADPIHAKIIQLLERVQIPEGCAPKADALKQRLKHHDKARDLETIFDEVTSLLVEINVNDQSKQQEIDKFLAHITGQITELGLTINDSGIALMDASLNRSRLDQSVSDQINELQNRSTNATQLEPLKQVISSHIAKITVEIQEHKQKEAVQREKYQSQLEELSQKIKVMESETGELRSKLVTANTNAQRDSLTDLPNRLAYDERLKMEISRWQRYHTPLCLVIWDIDFFKKVNDQYGHQVGDKVLVHVANLFSENIRRADFIARFGGEEFIMLLPHTNRHSALVVSEKLRSLIEQSPIEIQNDILSLTVSCGVTQFLNGDGHESAFERADKALYRAKEEGRNRCCVG